MVAFATEGSLSRTLGTPTTEAPEHRNRARGIFLTVEGRAGENGRESRHPRREKAALSYETASGPTNFLNRDPINEIGSMLIRDVKRDGDINEERNLYAFVGNDPINRWDHLGLSFWCWLPWVNCDEDEDEEEEIDESAAERIRPQLDRFRSACRSCPQGEPTLEDCMDICDVIVPNAAGTVPALDCIDRCRECDTSFFRRYIPFL